MRHYYTRNLDLIFDITETKKHFKRQNQKLLRGLGESNCLKIIINHYRDNIKKLEEISRARGTNLQVLLKSYNISYNNDDNPQSLLRSSTQDALCARGVYGTTDAR